MAKQLIKLLALILAGFVAAFLLLLAFALAPVFFNF